MIKKIVYCDRCKREITGSSYYTVDVYAKDLVESKDGRQSLETASRNVATNFAKVFGKNKQYCASCINKLERFLIGEDVK